MLYKFNESRHKIPSTKIPGYELAGIHVSHPAVPQNGDKDRQRILQQFAAYHYQETQ
jgi:hypothetical protein